MNKYVHACCVGASHLNYRVLAMREVLGEAQDFMRLESEKVQRHLARKAPLVEETASGWVAEAKIDTTPLVGFIATWCMDLERSELVNCDFSEESGCWDRRLTTVARARRQKSFY